METISVVIPTYNSRQMIAGAIRSAIAQTRPPDEIIVVDDGSEDHTEDFVRGEFGDAVQYLRQLNQGPSAARNAGVQAARGDWVAFLDADNWWPPQKLERQVAVLRAHPEVVLVASEATVHRPDGTFHARLPQPFNREVLIHRARLKTPFAMTVLIRREVFHALGGFDTSLTCGEDRELWSRVARLHEVAVVPESLLDIIVLPTGISSRADLVLRDGLIVNRRVISYFKQNSLAGRCSDAMCLRRADARVYLSAAYIFQARRELRPALKNTARALLHWPLQPLSVYALAFRLLSDFGRSWISGSTACEPEENRV